MTHESRKREERYRRKTKQWVRDAVAYWSSRISECDIGCDWPDADVRCWRCGEMRTCQKCHIVPAMLGGTEDASNIIPLCAECHDEMPNVADAGEVWRWIKDDHCDLYESFWFIRALKASGLSASDLRSFSVSRLRVAYDRKIGIHFGQLTGRARITTHTRAWALRYACGRIEETAK